MRNGNKTAAILLSRQPLRPTGGTGWVRQAGLAVRWIKDRGMILCCSIGMQTWEVLTALAVAENVPLKLVIPHDNHISFDQRCHETLRQLNLGEHSVTFIMACNAFDKSSKSDNMKLRDRAVIEFANLLLPVSVRKDGGMNALISEAEDDGIKVDRQFEIDYTDRSEPMVIKIDSRRLRDDLDELAAPYLIHWTRTTNSAWPDERLIDYYRAIVASETYPRLGLSTLEHILQTRRLIGSTKNMPGNEATISFSALLPSELIPLMKWRARYRQMSFEPYGIGIRIPVADHLGISPVRYYDKAAHRADVPEPRWLSQSAGEKTDWRREKEYRHLGDLGLSKFDNDDLFAICLPPDEALGLEARTGLRTVSVYSP